MQSCELHCRTKRGIIYCIQPILLVYKTIDLAVPLQGGFSISTDNLAAKQYYFCARTEKEREEWVDSITNAK